MKTHASGSAQQHLDYRPEIDGLRAFAILSVLLFHAFPFFLQGGFVGVDVFFVISGYLISSIIFRGLEAGDFSFADFYRRRIRRIFPALVLVLLAGFVVGWFSLLATDLKMLGKHMAGGIGFVQNIVLYREDGYFDTSSELKPLLHLWSLGVEEQFYIVFPLLAWGLWRWRAALLPVVVGLALVSFIAGVSKLQSNPSAAFYVPQYRFWEILCGSLIAYCSVFRTGILDRLRGRVLLRDLCALLGSILLVVSVVVISEERAFPGYWALLPVSGSALMIIAGPQAWLNRTLMSHPILVLIGLISYPLYLWHWVVITYIRIIGADELSVPLGLFAVFASVLLAFLTYRFVELPVRRASPRIPKVAILLTLGTTVAAIGMLSFVKDGIPFRPGLPGSVMEKEEYAQYFENSLPGWAYFTKQGILDAYRSECDFFDLDSYRAGKKTKEPRQQIDAECYIPKTATKVMIWGDSHAQQYYYGLRKVLPDYVSILQVASSGCEANFPGRAKEGRKYCEASNRFALDTIAKERPDILLIAQANLHDQANSFVELSAHARSLGVKRVVVIGPVPQFEPFLYQVIVRKHWAETPRRMRENLIQATLDADSALLNKYSDGSGGFDYLSAVHSFCNAEGCLTYLGDDRRSGLVTFDYGHLTPPASVYFAETALAPLIMNELAKPLSVSGPAGRQEVVR